MNSSTNHMTNRNNDNGTAMPIEELDGLGALPTRESIERHGSHGFSIGGAAARTNKFRQRLQQEGGNQETQDVVSISSEKTWVRGSSEQCRANTALIKKEEKALRKKKKAAAKKKKEKQRRESMQSDAKNEDPTDQNQVVSSKQRRASSQKSDARNAHPQKQVVPSSQNPGKPPSLTPATSSSSANSRPDGRTHGSTEHTASKNEKKKKSKSSAQVEKLAAKVRSDRIKNGQCPTCGILLYKVKVKGVFKRVMQRKPITLEGQVLHGKCLMCTNQEGDNAAKVVVSAVTSDIHDIDAKEKDMYRMDHGVDVSSNGNLSTEVHYVGERKAPFNAAALTSSSQGSRPSDTVSRYEDQGPNSYVTGKVQEEDADRPSLEDFACVPNNRDDSVYEGGFNHLGAREGRGELFWSNGDRYSGQFARNARNGQGSLFFADGGEYVGTWVNDKMHQEGTRRYENGDVYTGSWIGGYRHGEGQYFFSNGDAYVGTFQNGKFHGFGRYYYADGSSFEGTYARGLRSGKGKFQSVSGEIDVQGYSRDQRVGEGVRWSVERQEAWRLFEDTVRGHVTQSEAAQIVTNCECASWETMVG